MTGRLVVTGTDTDIGKTVVCAMLTLALGATYFKPIQAGVEPTTDREEIKRLTGLSDDRVLKELYCLKTPASPHYAAELDDLEIEVGRLQLPETDGPLIVEGAGGLLVPVTRRDLFIDLFAAWGLPVVLCSRTALGTINHSLLSIEALKRRNIPIQGIVFVGDANPDSERTIVEFGGIKRLGRLPWLESLTASSLAQAFERHFKRKDFETP